MVLVLRMLAHTVTASLDTYYALISNTCACPTTTSQMSAGKKKKRAAMK